MGELVAGEWEQEGQVEGGEEIGLAEEIWGEIGGIEGYLSGGMET